METVEVIDGLSGITILVDSTDQAKAGTNWMGAVLKRVETNPSCDGDERTPSLVLSDRPGDDSIRFLLLRLKLTLLQRGKIYVLNRSARKAAMNLQDLVQSNNLKVPFPVGGRMVPGDFTLVYIEGKTKGAASLILQDTDGKTCLTKGVEKDFDLDSLVNDIERVVMQKGR